jgi:serine/threonine-protein kinase RsbW
MSDLTSSTTTKIFNIDIPSELGYEKIPISAIALVAKKMGFSPERVEILKTVIGEAVTNAIEHGNQKNIEARVQIVLTVQAKTLVMEVFDQGKQPIPTLPVKRGKRKDWRGWGLGLIQELTDEVTTKATPQRNEIRMTAYLKQET